MTYHLSISKKTDFLHARVTGRNTLENVKRYLKETLQACNDANCSFLLVEEELDGPRLNTFDVFKVAAQSGDASAKSLRAIAYVDVNAVGDLMQFMETVAVNRGMFVRVFSNVDEAAEWLLKKAS